MSRININDLPPKMREQAQRQLATRGVSVLAVAYPAMVNKSEKKKRKPRQMNKTEQEFYHRLVKEYGLENVKYEGLTFRMINSHKYTPDFYIPGRRECYEVKGSYKLQSHQRARLAYDQAATEFKDFQFYWFEKTQDGWVQK